jgi:hypothetical protein
MLIWDFGTNISCQVLWVLCVKELTHIYSFPHTFPLGVLSNSIPQGEKPAHFVTGRSLRALIALHHTLQ